MRARLSLTLRTEHVKFMWQFCTCCCSYFHVGKSDTDTGKTVHKNVRQELSSCPLDIELLQSLVDLSIWHSATMCLQVGWIFLSFLRLSTLILHLFLISILVHVNVFRLYNSQPQPAGSTASHSLDLLNVTPADPWKALPQKHHHFAGKAIAVEREHTLEWTELKSELTIWTHVDRYL